jgi:hypothetical protein
MLRNTTRQTREISDSGRDWSQHVSATRRRKRIRPWNIQLKGFFRLMTTMVSFGRRFMHDDDHD